METSMFDFESGCCCLCLTATLAPNTSMFDMASWMSCIYVWCCSLCACTQWLLSRAFAHEITLINLIFFVGLVNIYYNVYVDVWSWLLCLCMTQCTWSICWYLFCRCVVAMWTSSSLSRDLSGALTQRELSLIIIVLHCRCCCHHCHRTTQYNKSLPWCNAMYLHMILYLLLLPSCELIKKGRGACWQHMMLS